MKDFRCGKEDCKFFVCCGNGYYFGKSIDVADIPKIANEAAHIISPTDCGSASSSFTSGWELSRAFHCIQESEGNEKCFRSPYYKEATAEVSIV